MCAHPLVGAPRGGGGGHTLYKQRSVRQAVCTFIPTTMLVLCLSIAIAAKKGLGSWGRQ